jgi:hypothetical protein
MARFSWNSVISIIGNVMYASVYPTMCTANSPLVYLSQIVVCMNYGKLIRRISVFKKIFKILMKVLWWFSSNSIFFVLLSLVLALITFSVFFENITFCSSSHVEYILDQDCDLYGGKKTQFRVNFSSLWQAAFSVYASMNRVHWFHLLQLSLFDGFESIILYKVLLFMIILTLCTYLYLAFQGMAITLNFITIEKLSIHNAGDPLSKAGQQMVMTEELIIQRGLPVKPHLNKNRVTEICREIVGAKWWNFFYCFVIIGGYVFTWTAYAYPHLGEQRTLPFLRNHGRL